MVANGCIGVIRRVDNKLYIENCGSEVWYLNDGSQISKGERVMLEEGYLFETRGGFRKREYTFLEKKSIK